MPKALRAELHERVADLLIETEDALAGGGDETVGFHLEQAWLYTAELHAGPPPDRSLAQRAAAHLWSAARHTAELADMTTADALYQRVQALLPDEPSGELLEEHSAVLVREFSDYQRADDYLVESMRRASASGNRRGELRARLGRLNIVVFATSENLQSRVEREARELLAAMEHLDDPLGITRAWQTIGFCDKAKSRYAETIPLLTRALPPARRSGDRLEQMEIFYDLVDCLYDGPTPASQAIAQCDQVLVDAPGLFNQLWTMSALTGLHAMAGNSDRAREFVTRTDQIADELDAVSMRPYHLATVRARQYAAGRMLGDLAMIDAAVRGMPEDQLVTHSIVRAWVAVAFAKRRGGRDAARRVVSITDPSNTPQGRWISAQAALRIDRAEALWTLGDHDAAVQTAREAVALAATTDALNTHAAALVTLARLTPAEESSRFIQQAVALWDAKGNTTMSQRTRRWLADGGTSPLDPVA